MKKIFLFLFIISTLYANHIRWLGDYNSALQKARQEDKILMVLLIKNSCTECKNLVQTIFTDHKYIDEINRDIVSVIINFDNLHSYPIEMYWSNEYPTIFFVDSHTEIFINKPLYGEITERDIENRLNSLR